LRPPDEQAFFDDPSSPPDPQAAKAAGVSSWVEDLVRRVDKINFGAIWFTAAALGMGRVLTETKALDVLTSVMMGWMATLVKAPLFYTLTLYWTGFIYHLFLANETAMLSTSLPVVLRFFMERGFHPLPIGMIWTFAAGGKIFAYQSAVLIVGYSFGYFKLIC
jgi:hypothetical protein